MKKIAVIPARAGSKRLENKNKLSFRGKPLIEHTIAAALEAKIFDQVIVSSDDGEILELARRLGVDVEARKPELAGDRARVAEVCADILERKPGFELLCCLYATAPLRTAGDILASLKILQESKAAAVICATRYLHPAHQALCPDDRGGWKLAFPEWGTKQSQLVPPLRVDNGSCYWVRVPEFLKERNFYLAPLEVHEMPIERSIDLDTAEDWRFLEKLSPRIEAR